MFTININVAKTLILNIIQYQLNVNRQHIVTHQNSLYSHLFFLSAKKDLILQYDIQSCEVFSYTSVLKFKQLHDVALTPTKVLFLTEPHTGLWT